MEKNLCRMCVCCPVRQHSIYVCVSWQSESRCDTMNNNWSLHSQSLTTEWITHTHRSWAAPKPKRHSNHSFPQLIYPWIDVFVEVGIPSEWSPQIPDCVMNQWHKESLLRFVAEWPLGQNAQSNMDQKQLNELNQLNHYNNPEWIHLNIDKPFLKY